MSSIISLTVDFSQRLMNILYPKVLILAKAVNNLVFRRLKSTAMIDRQPIVRCIWPYKNMRELLVVLVFSIHRL